ncbi:MAG: hypothetical protein RBS72_15115 [Sedimentisphaerales bacterium]|jgi:hypothetical protein|nr:hypothetical protein [Sedimentisphaerales bacterium]HNY80802.1 hypothetical protein [Sedimentisphaerales bacterium]HOC62268.1 hypothetical protein [Sedimentisphaerales bacterium]HOH66651.1 hypothetical protein [Sedimentisphaerales bacterium]HQA91737.1 hypothetical protein [Sedimentisphaerales bacterium]
MRRYSGQKALYEAISRSRSKPGPNVASKGPGLLERLKPHLEKLRRPKAAKPALPAEAGEPAAERPAPPVLKPPKPVGLAEPHAAPGPSQTWLKPKAIQFNAGRIEVSLPYQIGIAIGLFVILILLAVFRLGQIDQKARYRQVGRTTQAGVDSPTAGSPGANPAPGAASTAPQHDAAQTGGATTAAGDNWIVIARSELRKDLEPVKRHFDEQGIQTGIVAFEKLRGYFAENGLDGSRLPQGDGYFLVTMQTYDNPDRQGSNGYEAKQKIIEIGALYKGKAPPGCESFGPRYFSDAYGLKIINR